MNNDWDGFAGYWPNGQMGIPMDIEPPQPRFQMGIRVNVTEAPGPRPQMGIPEPVPAPPRQRAINFREFPLKKITAQQRANVLSCAVCLEDFGENQWARELSCKVSGHHIINRSVFIRIARLQFFSTNI